MATGSAKRSYHSTIASGGTAETVTLDGWNQVEVVNRDATAEIYFTTDGSTVPTVGGAETDVLTPGQALVVPSGRSSTNNTLVKVIASATGTKYSVRGVPDSAVGVVE